MVEVIGRGNATAQTGAIWKTGTTACSSLAVSFIHLNKKYDLCRKRMANNTFFVLIVVLNINYTSN